MITDDNLRQIMPNLPQQKRADYLPLLQQAMEEFGINTALREAAFLAQVAHESAEFRFMEEIWGPTKAQKGYEGRKDLGNTQPGDGFRFKGRGPIQITGRANYKKYGQLLGVDLISNPPVAATKEVAFRIAGVYWKNNGLNELADQQMFKTITKRINGGFNGLEDRVKYYDRAKRVLGIAATRAVGSGWMPEDTGDDSDIPLFTRGSEATAEAASVGELEESAATGEKKRAAKGGASKGSAKKGAAKKASASRAGAKKAGAKKAAKKSGVKKAGAKKATKGGAKKNRAGKASTRKAAGKNAGAGKKTGAKKSAAKKGAAKKVGASKAAGRKAGAKKSASKKSATKRSAAKKGTRKR